MRATGLLPAIICLALAALPVCAQGTGTLQSGGGLRKHLFMRAVEKTGALEKMTYRVGFGMEPGEFHRLSRECLRYGQVEEFKILLKDQKPLVRVMGLICLAQLVSQEEFAALAGPLRDDRGRVVYTNGCILDEVTTVGEIAQSLIEKRFFYLPEWEGIEFYGNGRPGTTPLISERGPRGAASAPRQTSRGG